MCVLDPVNCAAVRGIVCETNCEIRARYVRDTCEIRARTHDPRGDAAAQRYTYTGTSEFHEILKRRAPIYPENNKLLDDDDMKEAEEWQKYMEEMIKGLNEDKWPIDKRRIGEVRGGTGIVPAIECKWTPQNVQLMTH